MRARLTILLALAVLVALGGAAKVVDWRADSEMQQRFDDSLLARAQAFAALVRENGANVEVDDIADGTATFPGAASNDWYAVTCRGKVITQSDPAPPPVAAGSMPRYANARGADGRELRTVALQFKPSPDEDARPASTGIAPVCELRYALDRGPLEDILRTLDWILVGSLLGACALVLLLTPWLVHRGLRPLAVLDRAMAGIGPDAPGVRLPPSGTRELAPLVARFNEVLARMDEGLARERQFAAGMAHELRTRLTELHTLVDVETRYPSERQPRALLAEIGKIGDELEATVTALLQLTRIESGLERSHHEQVPLAPLLARLQARHAEAAQSHRVRIESSTAADSQAGIATDAALLEIVLDNLLGNAVAYAPADSTIRLTVDRHGIEVCNAAPTLQAGDLAHFGQRFWRNGEPSTGHAGLGLALASAAARALRMPLSFALDAGVLRATVRWHVNG